MSSPTARFLLVVLWHAVLWLSVGVVPGVTRGEESTRPEWIWADTDRHEPQRIELRKSFRIGGPIHRADLRLASEFTRCELRVDGRTVLTLDDYGPWIDLDITDQFRSGDEAIEIRCHGSQGPSAVVLELVITSDDGRREVIRSGPDWQARLIDDPTNPWKSARSFGAVAAQYWDADRTARITPLDNYEQWRQASDSNAAEDLAKFFVRPGFEIQRVRSAEEHEGSWVSMEFDPQGRLTIAREDRGLLRMTLASDGGSVTEVETLNDTLAECRGLVYANGSLYAQANNAKGMYRLDDRDGDGHFETTTCLRDFPGGVGHGRNDLCLGPDDEIYAIFGDSVDVPKDNVIDFTSPFREARRGEPTTEGHVLRYSPQSSQWHLWCSGLRNPFGIDFNVDGEAFTYDADAEFDMGAPWYRPTRLVQLVRGGDYGWRGRTKSWPPYDADHADFTLPAGDIGKGSPTAVKSGARSAFPAHYRRSMFALDWAYGRILACHLVPRGAGYACRAETFLKGRPLNVTDLDFAPDGTLYIITGGRKTHSDLYRIRWTGAVVAEPDPTPQQLARREFSRAQRTARRRLAAGGDSVNDSTATSMLWESIGDADPMLRDAARVALERQPIDAWSELGFDDKRPAWVISSMLALARSEREEFIPRILQKLLEVPLDSLTGYERSQLLETWSRCLTNPTAREAPAYRATVERIAAWYPDTSSPVIAPTGAGRSVNHQLALLAERLDIPNMIPKTLELLTRSRTQEERLHAIFVLRNRREGWTLDSCRTVLEALGDLERDVTGGEGMPGFLDQIRQELIASMPASELASLGDLIKQGTEFEPPPLHINRPVVKNWHASDVESLLTGSDGDPNYERGRELFGGALCDRCHRAGGSGGVIGPDLTSVARRFGRGDLLLSIIEPSRVVDEKYRNVQLVTADGRVIVGRIVNGGDYRSTKLRIATDPLRPAQIVEIEKSEIERHQASPQSPMPAGLLDTFTADEIRDLLAYLSES